MTEENKIIPTNSDNPSTSSVASSVETKSVTAAKPAAVATPEVAKPVAAKPVAAKPEAAKPEAAKPVASKPVASKPEAAKPATVKSAVAKPAAKKAAVKPAAKKTAAKPAAKKVAAKPAAKKATAVKSKAKVTAKKAAKSVKASSKQAANNVEQRIAQVQELLQENLGGLSGDKAEQMARNVWLAGLGVYSRTFEEISDRYDNVQDRYEDINAEGQKMIDELVERGQAMQGDFEQAVTKGKTSLEGRVEELKERFGGLNSFVDIPGRLRDAAEKIEEFSERMRKKSD